MTLIVEAHIDSDFCQVLLSFQEQLLGFVHSLLQHELIGRKPHALFELSCEVEGAQSSGSSHFFERNILTQIEVNKFDGPLELTG